MDKTTKQQALNAHSWAGVFLSVLLFLVCLSGTIAVFHLEFERWEQPHIQEMESVTPQAIEKAMDTFLADNTQETHHLYVVFPTSDIPRLVVENDHAAFFADNNGNLIEKENVAFTKMLVDLHLYLNLPHSWGMILVSALGAVICALVFSGIIAHKRIRKDAFKLRRKGNGQQAQIDLHNRFGLWAAPFHLVIGITGAYFGLAGVILVLVASLNYGGDRDAIVEKIFTPDPALDVQEGKPAIGKAFGQMESLAPEKSPIFLTVHEVGKAEQFIEIYAKAPNRMIYAEGYRFDTAGNFIGVAGYEHGEWGKQLVWSMYRLHFGDFAGLTSKWLYFVLGVMLTMLCVSGMEIWLSKKAHPPLATRLWYATVWGSVSALSLTAIADMLATASLTLPLAGIFWAVMLLNTVLTIAIPKLTKAMWLMLSGVSVLLLLVSYAIVHAGAMFSVASLQLNVPMAVFVLWCFWRAKHLFKLQTPVHHTAIDKTQEGAQGNTMNV